MSESQQDPSASTARFRAFVDEAPPEQAARGTSRNWLIWGAVAAVAIIIIIVIVVAVH